VKVLTILGARPQFIKAASLSKEFYDRGILEVIVHTGQHFDTNMSDIFFSQLSIPLPKYNLNIHSVSHGMMVGRMLEELEKIMIIEKPDWVVVYGDTNSTLSGALAAKKIGIKIAHIEAGLRSYNEVMPEETNRVITDRISDLLLCPSKASVTNLEMEGFRNMPQKRIVVTGDIMYDSVKLFADITKNVTQVPGEIPYIMVTLHRAENTNDPERLESIFRALAKLADQYLVKVVLHPRTKLKLQEFAISVSKKILIINPLGYLENLSLLNGAKILLTDSGGMQKEAYFLKKKCVTLRDETEWTELIDSGCNILSGANESNIISAVSELLTICSDFSREIYGDGNSRKIIVDQILNIN
jgi:UDP-GlcNAc3NAcA epimerase